MRFWERINDRQKVKSAQNLYYYKNHYNDQEFQTFIFKKTQQFKNDPEIHLGKNLSISKIAGLSFVSFPSNETEIVDLGGGAGLDFFIFKELFNISKKWTCIETQAMCLVIAKKKFKQNDLNFKTLNDFLQDTRIGRDFSLYSNSALQYFTDPISVLNSLLLKRPKKVAILRTPFVIKGPAIEVLQKSFLNKNGPQLGYFENNKKDISMSANIVSLDLVKAVFKENNYQIVCANTSVGSFSRQSKFRRSGKSLIRTVDLFAHRMN